MCRTWRCLCARFLGPSPPSFEKLFGSDGAPFGTQSKGATCAMQLSPAYVVPLIRHPKRYTSIQIQNWGGGEFREIDDASRRASVYSSSWCGPELQRAEASPSRALDSSSRWVKKATGLLFHWSVFCFLPINTCAVNFLQLGLPPLAVSPYNSLSITGRDIIMNTLYNHRRSPWLDLKVFYVRLSNCEVDDSTPEHLNLIHIPLNPATVLEVNGRSSINSDLVSSRLRRDRVDRNSEEATFIGTDSVRMTGSVKFEVYDGENLLLSGALELLNSNGFTEEPNGNTRKWSMKCHPVMSGSSYFLKGKQSVSPETALPTIEVYVAGSFSGSAIILTKTLQLGLRKKKQLTLALDAIPENNTAGAPKRVLPDESLQVTEYEGFAPENDVDIDYNSIYARSEYMEEEDGELSWFNAGVRVGVGLGLGICLGVGIGVGLLVRSYQSATRTFKRRLL
ncbi:Uncharacterized protein AXF42_Ash004241 [Apostasia shenzhenica]|uniref:Erythronate-4-phosphate dehydrogenase family protein n=1 Tax=Apostasia shenzhenica TaxID=1088818 RepID=A0A2I0A2C6_9ASPA|nr:Uncharacterized protein AXF42_Ash004241 [Apostasia shenzhenica]